MLTIIHHLSGRCHFTETNLFQRRLGKSSHDAGQVKDCCAREPSSPSR